MQLSNKNLKITLMTILCLWILPVYPQDFTCKVISVESGDHFTCSNKKKVKIWGIEAPKTKSPQPEDSSAKNYLKNFILNKELVCHIKGKQSGKVIAQCVLDLQVKSIDVADPLIIGKHVKELKEESKGYYSDPNRPRSE